MRLLLDFVQAFLLPGLVLGVGFLKAQASEVELCRRIDNHLLIQDSASAVKEAEQAVSRNERSLPLLEGLIKAYARAGEETKMLQAFEEWKRLSTEKCPRRLYEEMCWGVIEKGGLSGSPMIRTIALLAAHWGQDARGVKLVEKRLGDTNALVKQVAVEVASRMQDERIKRAVAARYPIEKDWETHLLLIRAAGATKIKEMKPTLMALIADPTSTLEEKQAATEALLALLEKVPRSELLKLSDSDRMGLRALAAEIIAYQEERESLDILWRLASDESAEVRGQAVLGLALLDRPTDVRIERLLQDREFHVALVAAYSLLIGGSDRADGWIRGAIATEKAERARLVAAMLASSGSYGLSLAKELIQQADDFYVRMNLALALAESSDPRFALDILYEGLTSHKERWAREKIGVFQVLTASREKHRPLFPDWPEVVNKETRLEIMNLLAVKEHPLALKAAREFLKDKGWGISGLTSVMLLTEGGEEEVELVRPLLNDPDPDIRLQAALILTRWDPKEVPVKTLTENYEGLSREKKEIVLQALGALGDEEATDFLVKEMGSTHASLRLIASASLLKSLYE